MIDWGAFADLDPGWLVLAGIGLVFFLVALRIHWRERHLPKLEHPLGQKRISP